MKDRSPLRRFGRVSRAFGLVIAMKVAYSKIRGTLFPALALPNAAVQGARRREISVLLSTAEHDAATMEAIVQVLAERGGLDWEVCICERSPAEPEMARAIAHLRGTQPWIRIVTADTSVDDTIAARWTVEQATGQFVVFVATGHRPTVEAITQLATLLRNDSHSAGAILLGNDVGSGEPALPASKTSCRLLLLRKSNYLAVAEGRWLLTASVLAQNLGAAGLATVRMAA